MATLLQLVLDEPGDGVSPETARGLVDLVDALELGPRLLRSRGPALVRALRDAIPGRPVACWVETEEETATVLEAGVEGLTLPASLSDGVLAAIIALGRRAGRRILLDLAGAPEAAADPERLMRLRPDLLKIPVDVDVREVVARLRTLELPLGFCGEWTVSQVPWLLLYRPVVLMAGSVVASAPDPRRVLEAIRARMTVAPTMSRFY